MTFIYVPKGRAPPSRNDLPDAFHTHLAQYDLDTLGEGLNVFQSATFPKNHPLSSALSILKGGVQSSTGVQISGKLSPLIFDEPENSVKDTWSGSLAKTNLKTIMKSFDLTGHVDGLDGIKLGPFFKTVGGASFAFKGNKSGRMVIEATTSGIVQYRKDKPARNFVFQTSVERAGKLSWQGTEIDGDGNAVSRGQKIHLSAVRQGNKLADLQISLSGEYRVGDALDLPVPALNNLSVSDIVVRKDFVSAQIGSGSSAVQIKVINEEGPKLAYVSLGKDIRPASFIPGFADTSFADLVLPGGHVLILGKGVTKDDLAILPDAIDKDLSGLETQLSSGLYFLSRMGLGGKDALSTLAQRLGVSKNDHIVLRGRIPAGVAGALLGARTSGISVAGLDLNAELPRVSLPGVGDVISVSAPPRFSIRADQSGTLSVDLTAQASITNPLTKATSVADLNIAIDQDSVRIVSVDGSGMTLSVQASLKGKSDFQVNFENGMTLANLLGVDIPVIGEARLTNASISKEGAYGILQIGDLAVTASVIKTGGASVLSLKLPGLAATDVIPGVANVPFADMKLGAGVLTYVHTSSSGTALSLSQMPADWRTQF